MPKTKVRLTICGADYILVADDDEDYVRCIADEVEKRMLAVMDESPRLSMTTAAVLTALDCYDMYYKANLSADNFRGQIKAYLNESVQNRSELEEARRQIEALEAQVEALKEQQAQREDAARRLPTPKREEARQISFDSSAPHTPKTISAGEFFKMAGKPENSHEQGE